MTTKWTNPLEEASTGEGSTDDADVDQAKLDQEIKQAAFGTAETIEARFREKWYGILHPDKVTRGIA